MGPRQPVWYGVPEAQTAQAAEAPIPPTEPPQLPSGRVPGSITAQEAAAAEAPAVSLYDIAIPNYGKPYDKLKNRPDLQAVVRDIQERLGRNLRPAEAPASAPPPPPAPAPE